MSKRLLLDRPVIATVIPDLGIAFSRFSEREGRLYVHFKIHQSVPGYSINLVLERRSGGERLCLPLQHKNGDLQTALPDLTAYGDVARFDLWLEGKNATARWRVIAAQMPEDPRHFFVLEKEEQSVSAYLTDTERSIALFVAPAGAHAQTVAAEEAKLAFKKFLRDLPVMDNLVFFESFLGKAYAGNPRFIYEQLLKSYPSLQFVWSYTGELTIPGNPTVVRRGSLEYYWWLAQAKYRVNNVIFPVHGKKPETIYLQTWHGTPLKRLSFDIEVDGPEAKARDNFYQESRDWTVLLSENAYSTEIFRRAFRYDGHVLEAGYPLADDLHHPDERRIVEIKEQLRLPSGKRFILYAPTWRDHKAIKPWQHAFDLQLDLARFCGSLASDQVLLIKAHHLVSERLNQAELPNNAIDLSCIDDVNELCVISDVLITDYSSVFFDFAVSNKPILFFCYDLEQYSSEIRGFYLDVLHDLPGPVAFTTEELIALFEVLPDVTKDYAGRYAKFRQRFCALNDGHATRRVVDAVFGLASEP